MKPLRRTRITSRRPWTQLRPLILVLSSSSLSILSREGLGNCDQGWGQSQAAKAKECMFHSSSWFIHRSAPRSLRLLRTSLLLKRPLKRLRLKRRLLTVFFYSSTSSLVISSDSEEEIETAKPLFYPHSFNAQASELDVTLNENVSRCLLVVGCF